MFIRHIPILLLCPIMDWQSFMSMIRYRLNLLQIKISNVHQQIGVLVWVILLTGLLSIKTQEHFQHQYRVSLRLLTVCMLILLLEK
jgi:hypothetical protein